MRALVEVRNNQILALGVVAIALLAVSLPGSAAAQTTLLGSPFATSFDGWTDTYVVDPVDPGAPTWGVLLGDDDALCEANNVITGANTSARRDDAVSQNMVNMSYSTTSSYTLSANLGTWDDDGYGLIFGYTDENNYCRVSVRQQSADTFGFPMGISLQKVVGGTMTTLGQNNDTATVMDLLPYNDGAYYDLAVSVDGTTGNYSVKANFAGGGMVEYLSGTDTDVQSLAAGHYGVHSWAQKEDAGAESSLVKMRGTCVKTMTVDDGSDSVIDRTHVFGLATPVAWRQLMMTNADGYQGELAGAASGGPEGFNYGNFRLDFRDGTIFDDSNSHVWGTTTAPNTDFLGGAIVVDETGSTAWTDYEMNVRITPGDNEGPGVLVRVQDDNTFYRINFATQSIDWTGNEEKRCPEGLSIQKCLANGDDPPVWTELYRDDQSAIPFEYSDNVPFDLKVKVEGNAITVTVVDDPDGTATVYNYATIYDTTDPILSGSVGFTNWGAGDEFNGVYYSGYGGDPNADLVVGLSVQIPGDTNGDLIVNDADATVVAGNWGETMAGGASVGDFNGDGVINAIDASIMAAQWGNHNEGAGNSAIPEPSTLFLLFAGALGLLHLRRR